MLEIFSIKHMKLRDMKLRDEQWYIPLNTFKYPW
jgi:hypothetical protein